MPSSERLEPYNQGYRDGWYDRRRHDRKHRAKRRRANAEYRLGYGHGWEDGVGRKVDWWPTFALGQTSHASEAK